MAYVIRPTAIVPVAMLSAYVLLYHRPWFVRYLNWAMVIAIPWVAYNLAVFDAVIPPYYSREAFSDTTRFTEGLLGNLFSPSRGLLIFTPVLVFALSGFVLALRDRVQRPLHIAYGAIVVAHLIIVPEPPRCGGRAIPSGHASRPTSFPFSCISPPSNFRLPASFRPRTQATLSASIVVLALASMLIHAQGALRGATMTWNYIPNEIDRNPSRVWDWTDPQFTRTYRGSP